MATIFFEGEGLEVQVPDGTRIQEAIDKNGIDIPFGCREGACATCMIKVSEGMEFLNKVTDNEEMTLMPDELESDIRLACQCVVSGGRVSLQATDGTF